MYFPDRTIVTFSMVVIQVGACCLLYLIQVSINCRLLSTYAYLCFIPDSTVFQDVGFVFYRSVGLITPGRNQDSIYFLQDISSSEFQPILSIHDLDYYRGNLSILFDRCVRIVIRMCHLLLNCIDARVTFRLLPTRSFQILLIGVSFNYVGASRDAIFHRCLRLSKTLRIR